MSKPPQIQIHDKRGREYGPFHWKHVVEWHELSLLDGFTWETSGGVSEPISTLVEALGVPPSIMTRSILLAPPEDAPNASAESMAELHAAGFPVSIGPIPEETQKHIAEQMSLPDPMLDAEDADFAVGNPFATKTETASESLAEADAATEPDGAAEPDSSDAQKIDREPGAGENSTVESEQEPEKEPEQELEEEPEQELEEEPEEKLEAEALQEAGAASLPDPDPETNLDSTLASSEAEESEEVLEKPNEAVQVGEKAQKTTEETPDAEPNEVVGDSAAEEGDSLNDAIAKPVADAASDPATNIFLEGEEVDPSEAMEPDEIEARKKGAPVLVIAAALLIAIGGGVALFLLNQDGSAGAEVAAPAPIDIESEDMAEAAGTMPETLETAASAPSEGLEEVSETAQVDAPEEEVASSQTTDVSSEAQEATEGVAEAEAPTLPGNVAQTEASAVTEAATLEKETPSGEELATTGERSTAEESNPSVEELEPEASSQDGVTIDASPTSGLVASERESDEKEPAGSLTQTVATSPSPDPAATREASEETSTTLTETRTESPETNPTAASAGSRARVSEEAPTNPPAEREISEVRPRPSAVASSRVAEQNTTGRSEPASEEPSASTADPDDDRGGRRERIVEEFPDYVPSF